MVLLNSTNFHDWGNLMQHLTNGRVLYNSVHDRHITSLLVSPVTIRYLKSTRNVRNS